MRPYGSSPGATLCRTLGLLLLVATAAPAAGNDPLGAGGASAPWLPPDAGVAVGDAGVVERSAASLSLAPAGPIDLDDELAVFAHVFASLPEAVDVLPTENYLYWRFHTPERWVWGNLRLAPKTRDDGRIHIGYYEFREKLTGPEDANARYTDLGPEHGIEVVRRDAFHYDVTFLGRTVPFSLNELSQAGPEAFEPAPGETVLFRTQDESNVRFHLLFHEPMRQFFYVADEDDGPLDRIKMFGPELALDLGTGFLYYVDADRAGRKVLIGVFHRNTAQNNYFDGPADQLADNWIKDIPRFREFLHRAYPFTRGTVDEYGFYLGDDGNRVAVAPYYAYRTIEEVRGMLDVCGAYDSVAEFMSCFSPDGRASSGPDPTAPHGGFPIAGAPGLAGVRAEPGVTSYTGPAPAPLGPGSPGFFNEDWESGLGGWTATGLWHLVSDPPTSCPPPPVFVSPTTSAYFGLDPSCDFSTGLSEFGTLTSPLIPNLPSQSSLSFWYRRQTQGSCYVYDRSRVELSVNGGPFALLLELCDDSNTWKNSGPIDLSAHAGSSIQVRFLFDSIDAIANGFLGWMVDDVRIDSGDTLGAGGPTSLHMAGITWHLVGVTFQPQPPPGHVAGLTWHLVNVTWPPRNPPPAHLPPWTFLPPPPPPHLPGTSWHLAGTTWPPPRPIHAAGITWHIAFATFIPPFTIHNSGSTWHFNGQTFIPAGTRHNSGSTWHYGGESFIPPGTKHNSGSTWHYGGQSFIPPGTIHNSGSTWHYNGQSFIPPGTKHNSGSTWHVNGATFIPPGSKHNSGSTWHVNGVTFIPPGTKHASGITWHIPAATFIPPGSKHAAGITWHIPGATFVPPGAKHAAGTTYHLPFLTFIPPGSKHNSGSTWHYNPHTFIPAGTKHNSGVTWHYEPYTFIPAGTKHNSGVTWHYEPHTFIPAGAKHNSGSTWHYEPHTFIPAGTKHNSGVTWHFGGQTFIPSDAKHNSGITWHVNGVSFIPGTAKHLAGTTWHDTGGTFVLASLQPCDDPLQCETLQCSVSACNPLDQACEYTPAPGQPCDDDDPFTFNDTCDGFGSCIGETPPGFPCDDGNPCTQGDQYSPTGLCEGLPAPGQACDDANHCTFDDTCGPEGQCQGIPAPPDFACEDEDSCNDLDSCALGFCHGDAVPQCDDQNVCSGEETCDPQLGCDPGEPLACDDVCAGEIGLCAPPFGCAFSDPPTCGDSANSCLQFDCNPAEGGCVVSSVDCDDGNSCTADSCDGDGGNCVAAPLPDGVGCDDGNPCTVLDSCIAGTCQGSEFDCGDCSFCDPADGGCVTTAENTPCGDPTGDDCCGGCGSEGICVPGKCQQLTPGEVPQLLLAKVGTGDEIRFSWIPAPGAASGHALYEGQLDREFDSLECMTRTIQTEIISLQLTGSGSRYYLIRGVNDNASGAGLPVEGPLGFDSAGSARQPAVLACNPLECSP